MIRPARLLLLAAAALIAACSGPPPATPDADAGATVSPPVNADGGNEGGQDAGGSDGGDVLPDGGASGDGGTSGDGGMQAEVTWYRDVLPIVQESCQGCHDQGGIGPFPLMTYAEAAPLAASMADAVAQRRMPPWMPDPNCNSYKDERRLTDDQIATLVAWSDQGAPEGDPADAPPPPMAKPGLPWVDVTLDQGADYTPTTAAGNDDYHCFVLDPGLTSTKDVIGFDIQPGVRRMVHHVLLYAVTATEAANKENEDSTLGWKCFGGPGTQGTPQVVGGWVPGTPVTQYPATTGIRLTSGTVIVMQIHYNLNTGPAVADRTKVQLQYAQSPVAKPAYILPQAKADFVIQPMEMDYSVTDVEGSTPIPVQVYGVLPHMHQKGQAIKVDVTGSNTCLVDIPKWDFHWQQFYFLKTPVTVTPGQSRRMTCTWDNPTPATVTWGEETTQEMCLNYVYVTLP